MKKLLAIGLAACLPTGLAAEDPQQEEISLGTTSVLVIEDSSPVTGDVVCTHHGERAADCLAVHRAVLSARLQKVPARERGRWM